MVLVAGQRGASSAAVRVLRTRDSDVRHTLRAVRRADTAADIMEIIMAFGIPEGTPFFASSTLMHLASTSAISIRLVAVGAIIAELLIVGAVLPADGANARVAILAVGIA